MSDTIHLLVWRLSSWDFTDVDILGAYSDREDAEAALRVVRREAGAEPRPAWSEGTLFIVERTLNADPDSGWLGRIERQKNISEGEH